jgi:predicted ATPase/DNA-binding winged helix-turn-helix (wHTH) protein
LAVPGILRRDRYQEQVKRIDTPFRILMCWPFLYSVLEWQRLSGTVHMAATARSSVVSFGPFRLNPAERLLKRGDETLSVGGRSLDLLIALVARAGETISPRELIALVWPGVAVDDANLRVQIASLRKALGDGRDGARYVVNNPGRGYCFVAPVTSTTGQPSTPSASVMMSNNWRQTLPARLSRMVGRADIVRATSAQLMMNRLVSIVGPGGMGKTTVAVSIAHDLLGDFNGAIFFIDLAPLTDPRFVPTAVASALGLLVQTHDPLVGLVAFIGDRQILLVLDSCEHVIGVAAPLAERLISETPRAHVLATSRETLRVQGEHVQLLRALDCPPEDAGLTAAEALNYPAVELFMERAAASGYRGALTDAEAPIVGRICRRLDGIPLPIELAAGRTGSHGIQGTAELLDNRFGLLWQGRRTALPRHQTLNATLDWSYNLLSECEKVVLCRLSVFLGDFTLRGACSVASGDKVRDEDVAVAMAGLVGKSLISAGVINGTTYYRLLDTTRAYAAGKLATYGDADRTYRKHARSYSELLERDSALKSSSEEPDFTAYSPHVSNVRAALKWAFSDHGDIAAGIQLAALAVPLFVGLSLLEDCRYWCDKALAALDGTYRDTKQELILQEAFALSSMFTRGHTDAIRQAIERGLLLSETFGDHARKLQLLIGLNLFLTRLGDMRAALVAAERAEAVARVAKRPTGVVCAEWTLATAHHGLGNQAAAQRHSERGMALALESGANNINIFGCDHRVRGLANYARTLWFRGFSDRALSVAQQAIDEAANKGHPVSVCLSLVFASGILLWTGDLPRANDRIVRLIAYAGRYSLDPYHAVGTALEGALAIARNEPERGVGLLRTALTALHNEQYNALMPEMTGSLAEGLRMIGQFKEALNAIDGVIMRTTDSGATFYQAELMRLKAQVLASMAQPDRRLAVDCLGKAITIAQEQSALAFELRSAIDLARLLAESGEQEPAHRALSQVYDRFTEGFGTADLRTARKLIAELT